jgi:hypothetical protein
VTRVTASYIYVEGGTKYDQSTGVQYDKWESGWLRGPARPEELSAVANGEGTAGRTANVGNESEEDSPGLVDEKAEGN